MRLVVTGARGLVGSRIVELLRSEYDILPLSSREVDIRKKSSIDKFLKGKNIDAIINFAAKADVDGCEQEKNLGEESEAWKINVLGAKNLAEFCKENNTKIIYISTDFVFDGRKEEGKYYTEEDAPNPINFYAKTKYEGEKEVQESGADFIILRIAYPYRKEFEKKKDFVRAILGRLKEGQEVKAVTDHIMCPTFIDDVAYIIDKLIENHGSGIYHTVGNTPISPFNAALEIAEVFGLDKSLIKETKREEFFAKKAIRPFNLHLKNDKIKNLKLTTRSFKEGLLEMK